MTPEERARFCNDVIAKHPDDYEGIIAAEIRAAIADALRWIPVSERLPKEDETKDGYVLVYVAYGEYFLGWYADGNWHAFGWNLPLVGVTYWQELPPAPTEEQSR